MSLRDYNNIPQYTRESLERYVKEGIPPGDFLRAVLANDLQKAVSHADNENTGAIVALAVWIYNRAPSSCWGSKDAVSNWIKAGGSSGQWPNEKWEARW